MTDIDKLRMLLPHWIVHNTEHASEFRAWIERVRGIGQAHVIEHLEAAIQNMDAANRDLQAALEYLGGAPDVPDPNHLHADHDHSH
jgi:hypothetical protein